MASDTRVFGGVASIRWPVTFAEPGEADIQTMAILYEGEERVEFWAVTPPGYAHQAPIAARPASPEELAALSEVVSLTITAAIKEAGDAEGR